MTEILTGLLVRCRLLIVYSFLLMAGSVAQLDAYLTGDQEVAGSTPAGLATFFHEEFIMKYFLQSFTPFRRFKKGSCQFLAKECAQYWLTT